MRLESSLVRIFKNPEDRTIEGAGVYIGARRLLTCTHVVQALVPNPEQDAVAIDFPLLGDRTIFKAKAAPGCYLEPKPTPDSNRPGDICLLEIETGAALPENLKPAAFFDPDDGHSSHRAVHTCGFPEHMEMGERAYGQLIGPIEGGWVQLDAALTSRTVAPGYSGAPVWDQQTNQVAGIIVTRSVRDGQVAAYMIPTIQLAHLAPNILKKQTQATHECLPISFKRKCDRGAEITAFINYIKNMCDLGNCHHLFFVMGPRRACHVSLSKRLGESTRVRRALEKGLAREVLVEHLIIPWPVDDKPENGMDILLPPLFDQIYKTVTVHSPPRPRSRAPAWERTALHHET